MSSNQIVLSKFEFIPNEVLLETFEYLSSHDIFQTFYYLNKRYNRLLLSLHLRIDLVNVAKKTFDYYNYFLFSLIPHTIISLRCEDIFDRLLYQIRLSEFISLKYLTISKLTVETLRFIIPQLNQLQQLIYLNLQTRTDNIYHGNKIIFEGQLPLIEKCILNLNKPIRFKNIHPYAALEDLTINQCTMKHLGMFIHKYTPQLQYLTVTLIDGIIPDKVVKSHSLKSLVINTHSIPFHRLTNSVFLLFSHLQRLTINATGIDYTNGKQWETLLSFSVPQLVTFELHITFSRDDVPTPDDRLQLLKTFETPYYRHHNWLFGYIYRPSMLNIELFSLPIITKKFNVDLYNTTIETTMNDEPMFQNINELSVSLINSGENLTSLQSRFLNVDTLKLMSQFQEYQQFPKTILVDISRLVNFSHLKSIEFIGMNFPASSLVLLDYTPNLHSLTITWDHLIKMTKMLTDQHICQRLTVLIKHLTITSMNNVKDLLMFERLPVVFSHLDSLSLSLGNTNDLYILMTLLLSKMASTLKSMSIFLQVTSEHHILDQFMSWLIDYMHKRDLDLVDVKLTGYQLSFCF